MPGQGASHSALYPANRAVVWDSGPRVAIACGTHMGRVKAHRRRPARWYVEDSSPSTRTRFAAAEAADGNREEQGVCRGENPGTVAS